MHTLPAALKPGQMLENNSIQVSLVIDHLEWHRLFAGLVWVIVEGEEMNAHVSEALVLIPNALIDL